MPDNNNTNANPRQPKAGPPLSEKDANAANSNANPRKDANAANSNANPPAGRAGQPAKGTATKAADVGTDELKKKSRRNLLLTFLGMFVFLMILFMIFLVVMLLQGGQSNPILAALGVEAALVQQLFKTLVSLVFGFL